MKKRPCSFFFDMLTPRHIHRLFQNVCLLTFLSLNPEFHLMLAETVAYATVCPHKYLLSYTQVQCHPPLWRLHSNFGMGLNTNILLQPDILARANNMSTVTMSVASERGWSFKITLWQNTWTLTIFVITFCCVVFAAISCWGWRQHQPSASSPRQECLAHHQHFPDGMDSGQLMHLQCFEKQTTITVVIDDSRIHSVLCQLKSADSGKTFSNGSCICIMRLDVHSNHKAE